MKRLSYKEDAQCLKINFNTTSIQLITLTHATSAAYTGLYPTAPYKHLMHQRQLPQNPIAVFRVILRRALGMMTAVLDLKLFL